MAGQAAYLSKLEQMPQERISNKASDAGCRPLEKVSWHAKLGELLSDSAPHAEAQHQWPLYAARCACTAQLRAVAPSRASTYSSIMEGPNCQPYVPQTASDTHPCVIAYRITMASS